MSTAGGMFVGAYNERISQNSIDFREVSKEKSAVVSQEAVKAMKEVQSQRKKCDTISVSKESQEFLCSEAGYEKMKKDVEDLYAKNVLRQKELQQNNENDPFWSNTGNQWLVFSESLHKAGVYDDMSDDVVKEAETMLAKITAGMDHLSRIQYNTGMEFSDFYGHGANYFMDSNEVNLELESATAALRYFGDKFVGAEQSQEFAGVVDSFYSHNSQIIEGYQSPIESFNKAVRNMNAGKYKNSAIHNQYNQGIGSAGNKMISGYLGKVNHSREETTEYRQKIISLLENIRNNSDEKNKIWGNMKDVFLNYATNNSTDNAVRNYMQEQTKYTFSRIEGYWGELLNGIYHAI